MQGHCEWCSTRICFRSITDQSIYLFYFIKDSEICNYADENTLSFADREIDDSLLCILEKSIMYMTFIAVFLSMRYPYAT